MKNTGNKGFAETGILKWDGPVFTKVLCVVWFTGMVLALLSELVFACCLHRKLRYAIKQGEGVYCCNGISSAFVTGICRGRIYLPFGLNERDRGYILEHEKIHIRRRDYLVKKVCFAICLVYWFHPLVWLAYIVFCYDMEIACDNAVLRNMGREQRKQYSYVLLSNAVRERRQIPFYQPQFGKNMIKGRIFHSIHYKEEKLELVLVGIVVAILAAILCMMVRPDTEVVPMQKGGNYTKEAEQLYKKRIQDVTDKKAVKELLAAVISKDFTESIDESIEPFTCEIQGDALFIDFAMWIVRPDSFRRLTGDYSAIFLALIPDIRTVQWRYEEMQHGGITKTVTLYYDWAMMQKEDFIDASVCQVANSTKARDFGISASSLQMLINSFTYYEKGKTPKETKVLEKFEEDEMKKKLQDLPRSHKRSYNESIKCEELYVGALGYYSKEAEKGAEFFQKEYRRELWDSFLEKVKRGEAASVIIAEYNLLEDAKIEENGSVCYTYICYDGVRYYALYDFVKKDREDSFEMVSGKYLLQSEDTINDISLRNYYITDDASLSYRDSMYAVYYGGMTEFASFARPELHVVKTEYL
ncbi:MAG: M56 family metallopeptidase [Lachnospiraceae bacterium]|nr:M56 family metallopeptidase [Lachnospiraceae bacterium]